MYHYHLGYHPDNINKHLIPHIVTNINIICRCELGSLGETIQVHERTLPQPKLCIFSPQTFTDSSCLTQEKMNMLKSFQRHYNEDIIQINRALRYN